MSKGSRWHCWTALAVVLALGPVPPAQAAGVICGTVRDRTSGAAVPRAGIFLRTTAGAYTGLYGATDVAGHFCVANVPAGTYDLDVRVDDYRVGYRRNVVVSDQPVDVALDATLAARLEIGPVPARDHVIFRLELTRALPVQLEVFDVAGRMVRGWSASSVLGERVFTWDFRNPAGVALPSGSYRVRLTAGSTTVVRNLTRIR